MLMDNKLMRVKPQTNNQKKFFAAYEDRSNDVIVMHGCPGSGIN